jgi:hypothetical protein
MPRRFVRLIFDYGFEPEDTVLRGYRTHVWAELDDGSRHPMTFYNMTRLRQTLDDERGQGKPFFSEPGLVVVDEVTLDNMEAAARELAEQGFFDGKW